MKVSIGGNIVNHMGRENGRILKGKEMTPTEVCDHNKSAVVKFVSSRNDFETVMMNFIQ